MRVVFFTKAPIPEHRVRAMVALASTEGVELVGVLVEETVHLPWRRFVARTLRRAIRGDVSLPGLLAKAVRSLLPRSAAPSEDADLGRLAADRGIPVFRVKNTESADALDRARSLRPDLGVIYGHRILSEQLFGIPRMGTINVHFGLLPRYAGMDHSTFWALTEGAREVGLTIHRVDPRADHGDILLVKTIPALGRRAPELVREIAGLAPAALAEAVSGLIRGSLSFTTQDHTQRRYWKPPTLLERIRYRRYL